MVQNRTMVPMMKDAVKETQNIYLNLKEDNPNSNSKILYKKWESVPITWPYTWSTGISKYPIDWPECRSQARTRFAPASVIKLATSLAAMDSRPWVYKKKNRKSLWVLLDEKTMKSDQWQVWHLILLYLSLHYPHLTISSGVAKVGDHSSYSFCWSPSTCVDHN